VPALNNDPAAFSLQSVNYPSYYLSAIPDDGFAEAHRLGITPSPDDSASFYAVAGLSDPTAVSVQVASGTLKGLYITLNSALSGACAGNYKAPSGDVYLSDGTGSGGKAAATWTTRYTPPPPPPVVTIDVTNVTHTLNPAMRGCHSDR
jgi:hypothetical protein